MYVYILYIYQVYPDNAQTFAIYLCICMHVYVHVCLAYYALSLSLTRARTHKHPRTRAHTHLKPDVAFKVTLREELSNNRVCPLHVNFPFFAGIREVGSMQQRLQRKQPLSLIYSSEVQCAARLFSTQLLLSFLFLRFSKKSEP